MADKWLEDYIGHGIFDGAPESPEEIDAYLRSCGYDPDSLVSRLKVRIGDALQNAKLRVEREASMKRQNEVAAAKEAVIATLREFVDKFHPRWLVEVVNKHTYVERKDIQKLQSALAQLDALMPPAEHGETLELKAVEP